MSYATQFKNHAGQYGVTTDFVLQDGNLVVGRQQDITPFIEAAKLQRTEGVVGTSDIKFAGRIPDVEVEKYCNENGVSYSEFVSNPVHVKRYMNDPNNKLLRVWTGHL